MRFELVQPGEFDDYYYDVYCDDEIVCSIEFIENGWCISLLEEDEAITYKGLVKLAEKLNELNEATKAGKLFGFL